MTPRFTDETLNVLNVVKTMYQKSAGIQIVSNKSNLLLFSFGYSVCGPRCEDPFPALFLGTFGSLWAGFRYPYT